MSILSRFKSNRRNAVTLGILLLVLIIPRIAVYFAFGTGIVTGDSEYRYLPQAEMLAESFSGFPAMTGPLYSTFLMIFGQIFNDMITGPVIMQHLLGIVTALIVFKCFKRISFSLSLITVFLTYFCVISVYLEHVILREALAAFFLALTVSLIILAIRNTSYLKFFFGSLTAICGILLVLIRIEFLALLLCLPMILFIIRRCQPAEGNRAGRQMVSWTGGYGIMLLIFCLVYFLIPAQQQMTQTYGRYFNVAWHSLIPDVFYYDNSQYPELQLKFQEILESEEGYLWIDEEHFTVYNLRLFEDAATQYLAAHHEVEMDIDQLLDRFYIEIITHNTAAYLKSYAVNLQNHFLGQGEMITYQSVFTAIYDEGTSEIPAVNSLLGIFAGILDWLYRILQSQVFFWLFIVSLIFIAIRRQKIPPEIITALLVSVIHLLVLAFLSNTAHRFRYPVDPFIYIAQIYLILLTLQIVFTKPLNLIRRSFQRRITSSE